METIQIYILYYTVFNVKKKKFIKKSNIVECRKIHIKAIRHHKRKRHITKYKFFSIN